jgi:hypothetical protein
MTDENLSFIDYWNRVDAFMRDTYGIDTWDAGIEADALAAAQDDCISPEDFVLNFGEKYGLTPLSESRANWGRS